MEDHGTKTAQGVSLVESPQALLLIPSIKILVSVLWGLKSSLLNYHRTLTGPDWSSAPRPPINGACELVLDDI